MRTWRRDHGWGRDDQKAQGERGVTGMTKHRGMDFKKLNTTVLIPAIIILVLSSLIVHDAWAWAWSMPTYTTQELKILLPVGCSKKYVREVLGKPDEIHQMGKAWIYRYPDWIPPWRVKVIEGDSGIPCRLIIIGFDDPRTALEGLGKIEFSNCIK